MDQGLFAYTVGSCESSRPAEVEASLILRISVKAQLDHLFTKRDEPRTFAPFRVERLAKNGRMEKLDGNPNWTPLLKK
jgi:hypothetical protein